MLQFFKRCCGITAMSLAFAVTVTVSPVLAGCSSRDTVAQDGWCMRNVQQTIPVECDMKCRALANKKRMDPILRDRAAAYCKRVERDCPGRIKGKRGYSCDGIYQKCMTM